MHRRTALGSLLATPLLSAPALAQSWPERPVRLVANYTFTLYLLHQPLFLFWGAVVHGDPAGPGFWFTVTALMLLTVGVVGHLTENRRYILRDFLFRTMSRLSPARPVVASRHE